MSADIDERSAEAAEGRLSVAPRVTMDLIRTVLADDDPGMRMIMRKIVNRCEGFELLDEAEDGEELLKLVAQHHPQLVLLDVEMPKISGVEAARVIQDTDPATLLVFATAHDKYMADAFSVYAFDYLLKPFKVDRALQTLGRIRDVIRLREEAERQEPAPAKPSRETAGRLMLKHREGVNFLDMADILLIQRENRATVLYTLGDGRYVTSDSLSEMEEKLDATSFYRCHKSYIINLNHIDSISPYGRWTYIVKLRGTKHDALITHEKFEELERAFG